MVKPHASLTIVTTVALATRASAEISQLSILDPPEVSGHGKVTAAQIKAGASSRLLPECDFTGDGLDFNWIAFSDRTCFGFNNVRQCPQPWNLCDTSLGLRVMDDQTSVKAPKVITRGDWRGSFEGNTTHFKFQDVISFEEAIVLANGHNEPMTSSTDSFNAIDWKKAAGASTYYWGANEGSVASITRIGKDFCDPTPDGECEKLHKREL